MRTWDMWNFFLQKQQNMWKISLLFKLARVVNSILAFRDWLFYNLIILFKLMPEFIQSSIISKKPGYLSENLKTLPNWKLAHVSYLTMSTKRCSGFILFCLDLRLLIKNVKKRVCRNQVFLFLQITQDLSKIIKKSWTDFCRHCEVSAKILNSMVVGACHSFQFFRQKTWFLENNRVCLTFCMKFCIA